MPRIADLTGRRFGWLRAERPTTKRTADGQVLWECKCRRRRGSCRGRCLVTAKSLLAGHTNSCGCLKNAGCRNRLPSAASRRDAYKSKGRQLVDGRWWFALREAHRYVGVSYTTILNWQKVCPWLDGEGLEACTLEDANGPATFYAKSSLDRVVTSRAGKALTPKAEGMVYIGDAANELGCSQRTLHKRLAARGIKVRKVVAKGRDGKPRNRAYVPRSFVDKRLAEKFEATTPADKVTIGEAAAILKRSRSVVEHLIRRGELKRILGRAMTARGYAAKAALLSKADVEGLIGSPLLNGQHRERGCNGQFMRSAAQSLPPSEHAAVADAQAKQQGTKSTRGRRNTLSLEDHDLAAKWERARGAGVRAKDFAKDQGISSKELKNRLCKVRMAHVRAARQR